MSQVCGFFHNLLFPELLYHLAALFGPGCFRVNHPTIPNHIGISAMKSPKKNNRFSLAVPAMAALDQSPKWPLASRIEERWRPKRLAVLPRCPPCVSREVPREVGWALGPPPNLAGSLVKGVFQTKPFITRKKIP